MNSFKEVYMMRHALGTNTDMASDGILDLFDSVVSLKNDLKGRIPVIYSSPQGRAVNTAKLIAREFYGDMNCYLIDEDLNLKVSNLKGAIERLQSNVYPILLITHEPCLERFEKETGVVCNRNNASYTIFDANL